MGKAYTEADISWSFEIAGRLKDLRDHYEWVDEKHKQRKGISHEKLSGMLYERFGKDISASPASLKNYEVDECHSKQCSNLGMNYRTLKALAIFYGVSMDYIIGNSDLRVSDSSKVALERICGTPYRDALNAVLSSPAFFDMIRAIAVAKQYNEKCIESVFSPDTSSLTKLGEIEWDARHVSRDYEEDISGSLKKLCGFMDLQAAVRTKKKSINAALKSSDDSANIEERRNGEHQED